jgi:hypothetical protein
MEDFVDRFRKENPESEREYDLFLAWLQENGPDEWHRWAVGLNWGYGTELFEWIVAQPNCDRGTALSVYYGAQPGWYAQYATVEEALDAGNPDVVDLMTNICEMWGKGAYPTAYAPSDAAVREMAQGEDAMRALAASVPWDVPESLASAKIEGVQNVFQDSFDGVPFEMLRALGEDW